MKDLNEGKVQQWMGLIMIGSFCWVTYFNFQGFFFKVVSMFTALPFWWVLIVLPLFAMAVVWSISLGECEIKELEQQVQKNKRTMVRGERCLRLIHYDIQQIPHLQFYYYCTDLLRLLDYKEVKVVCDEVKDIIAINPSGEIIYIKCFTGNNQHCINQKIIEDFHQAMTADEVTQGLFLTTASFSISTLELANRYHIKCMDGKDLNELIEFVTREGKEQLKESMLG